MASILFRVLAGSHWRGVATASRVPLEVSDRASTGVKRNGLEYGLPYEPVSLRQVKVSQELRCQN